MPNISIEYLKKFPLIFSLLKKIYIRLKKLNSNFSNKNHIKLRIKLYRKIVDRYLVSQDKTDYKKVSKKIEQEIYKRIKYKIHLDNNWWMLFFKCIKIEKKSSDYAELIENLISETNSLPFSQHSSLVWFELYGLVLEYRLYSVGFIIRQKVPKIILNEGLTKKASQYTITKQLSAAFEEKNYSKIQDSLEGLNGLLQDSEEIFMLDLLLKKIIFKKNIEIFNNNEFFDKKFLDIIKGKRIAIVGPAPTTIANGKEIDSFDIIVRFNYKGESISSDYYGSRTDISYFNGANSKDVEKKIKSLNMSFLEAAVYKIAISTNISTIKHNRRMPLPLEHCTLQSSPFALPNVAVDLLLYSPSEVKIFACDMCLTHRRESSYGVMGKKWWENYYPRIGHDPYSTYLFIKYLYSNNFINVDLKLKKILDLGTKEYMSKLQEVYLN